MQIIIQNLVLLMYGRHLCLLGLPTCNRHTKKATGDVFGHFLVKTKLTWSKITFRVRYGDEKCEKIHFWGPHYTCAVFRRRKTEPRKIGYLTKLVVR